MSTQRGNTSKKRAQKHKNVTAFKNDKYDTTGKMKAINSLVVSNVCQRCKDCIEWKIKYKKYKPLTVPSKCIKCQGKKVKYAYHIVCSECALEHKICAKCSKEKAVIGEVEKSASEMQKEESKLREELKFMRLREKRTFLRNLDKQDGTIEKDEEEDDALDGENESESDDGSDNEDSV